MIFPRKFPIRSSKTATQRTCSAVDLIQEADVSKTHEDRSETMGTGKKKILLLISSFSKTSRQKAVQNRALELLKATDIGSHELEALDAADPAHKARRNSLFRVSGIKLRYPQFFLVDSVGKVGYLADWEGREYWEELIEALEEEMSHRGEESVGLPPIEEQLHESSSSSSSSSSRRSSHYARGSVRKRRRRRRVSVESRRGSRSAPFEAPPTKPTRRSSIPPVVAAKGHRWGRPQFGFGRRWARILFHEKQTGPDQALQA